MRAALLVALVGLAACYAPHAESGAYLCASDETCPDDLTCVCGQCVSEPAEAACTFSFALPNAPVEAKPIVTTITVAEHQPFQIAVQALQENGMPATKFRGSVKLSATWGDVCVGTEGCLGIHDRLQFKDGAAVADLQLNRETNAPTSALLRAEIAGQVGTSDLLRIIVEGPSFVRDPGGAVVAPIKGAGRFGPLFGAVGFPTVVMTSGGWRMYLLGGLLGEDNKLALQHRGIAVATSTDGKTFTPLPDPVFDSYSADGTNVGIGSVSAYDDGTLTHVYVARDGNSLGTFKTIVELTSPSGFGGFSLVKPAVLTSDSSNMPDCLLCGGLEVGGVIANPAPGQPSGGPPAQLYFSSSTRLDPMKPPVTVIGRAVSKDGRTFVADPAALLATVESETFIVSPIVVVDGTTYKMFYNYAKTTDLSNACKADARVGYATSSDGHFWVRSLRNGSGNGLFGANPDSASWEAGSNVSLTSVVPLDGRDPSKGWALYYTPWMDIGVCVPNGVGRATAK